MTASNGPPWMIYGAYGYTGGLIVEQAVQRGHKPILAGRDRQKVEALANRYGLQWQAVSLDDAITLRNAIRGKRLVLNAAGPFAETGWRLIDACLNLGTSYMDVSGEFSHLRTVEALDDRAKQAGIALLTGAGFGTTYGDCLAAHALERLPKATALRLSIAAANALTTPGARRTIVSVLADGGYIVSGGRFERRPLAHQTWTVRTTDSGTAFASAPLGELAALRRSTGIADIVVGRPMSRFAAGAVRLSSRLLQGAFKVPAIRRFASRDRGAPFESTDDTAGRMAVALVGRSERFRRQYCPGATGDRRGLTSPPRKPHSQMPRGCFRGICGERSPLAARLEQLCSPTFHTQRSLSWEVAVLSSFPHVDDSPELTSGKQRGEVMS